MGRVAEGKVIASTNVDRRGGRITPSELRGLFEQIPSERLVSLNHDPRLPPAARAFNTRLVELGDGELAIVSDFEVLDEALFEQIQGFSISFHRPSTRADDHTDAELIVSYNPRAVDGDALRQVVTSDPLAERIGTLERDDRSLAATVVIVWLLISKGFWDEAGADVYRFAKRLIGSALAREKSSSNVEAGISITRTADEPEIVLTARLDSAAEVNFSVDELLEQAQTLVAAEDISKVVASVNSSGGPVVDFVVDRRGGVICPDPQKPG